MGGGGAAGSSGVPTNSGAALAYQPGAQPQADVQFQSLLGGFLGGLGPAFQNIFPGLPSNAGPGAFSQTPAGQAYPTAQSLISPMTDPNNQYWQQALSGAMAGAAGSPNVTSAADTLSAWNNANLGYDYNAILDPAFNALAATIGYGGSTGIPQAEQSAQGIYNLAQQLQSGASGNIAQLTPQAQALGQSLISGGNNILSNIYPQAAGLGSNILGNANASIGWEYPNLFKAASGITSDTGYALDQFYPQVTGAAQQLLGGATGQLGRLPQATQASDLLYGSGVSALNTAMPLATNAANNLSQYGGQILGTAFDPQQELYGRTQGQVRDQAEAAAAAAGLGSSAYGAGVVGDTLSNFNIDWQNQQLARQAQGLGSAGSAFSTATQLPGVAAASAIAPFQAAGQLPGQFLSSLIPSLQAGSQLPGQFLSSLTPNLQAANVPGQFLQGLGAAGQAGAALPGQTLSSALPALEAGLTIPNMPLQQGGAIGQQIGQLSQQAGQLPQSIAQGYGNLGTQGNQLAYAGLQNYGNIAGGLPSLYSGGAGLGSLPYNFQNTATTNALNMLGQGVNIGNQQYTIPQQALNDIQSYLGLGQAASGLSGQLGQLALQQQQANAAGFGNALGMGSNLLFGNSLANSGGLLGAAGLNPFSTGAGALTASAFPALGASSIADTTAGSIAAFNAANAAAPAAASGGGFLGSILPFGLAGSG